MSERSLTTNLSSSADERNTASVAASALLPLRTLSDIAVGGKRVLVRVDFNVPVDASGHITDDTRIRAALPTITYLLDHHACVIVASHLGRPKGKRVNALSLAPVAKRLSELLGRPVQMVDDCVGPQVEASVAAMKPGDVLLLENLRFHPEEEANDPVFAQQLAQLADIYVDDAFGAAHRAHASVEGIAHYLPSVAGFLMQREVEILSRVLQNPRRPLTAVIGGAKISTKIGVLNNLLERADALIIGGGMANTFLAAQGKEVGRSLVEREKIDTAAELLHRAHELDKPMLLPLDVVVADRMDEGAQTRVVSVDEVPNDWMIVDIGPQSIEHFREQLKRSGTVVWNGPMGVFEIPTFAKGTVAIAHVLAESNAETIVGGGDSVAALEQAHLADRMTHVSTGGGASLEFLEGRELPGIAVLRKEAA
jgi:phosphoglycerate kinase